VAKLWLAQRLLVVMGFLAEHGDTFSRTVTENLTE
jgi:hypothetical protein